MGCAFSGSRPVDSFAAASVGLSLDIVMGKGENYCLARAITLCCDRCKYQMDFDIERAHFEMLFLRSTMTSRKDDIIKGEAVREHSDGVEREHNAA